LALEVDEVHTYYGESHVLQGISLRVEPGEVLAILGRNGMGKTTLIRSIVGFTPPRQGHVRYKDTDITRLPPFRMVELGMALVPQGRRVFPSLSVRENLDVARRGAGRWSLEQVYALFPRLRDRAANRANKLSGGEQQMLAIGRALMSNPEAVAACMPGARLDGPPQQDGRVAGRIEVRLGPIVASFSGTGTATPFPSEYRQRIEGHGADRRSGSRVSGSVDYRLSTCAGPSGSEATRVDVVIGYALTGLLAQLGRSGLARELAQRIGETFAQNVDANLRAPSGAPAPQARLGAVPLILAAMRARLSAWLARILRP